MVCKPEWSDLDSRVLQSISVCEADTRSNMKEELEDGEIEEGELPSKEPTVCTS